MATSNITNTIKDPSGTAIANVPVTVTLMPTAGFRSDTFTEVARTISTTTNGSGVWTLALERNSNITSANTYYEVVESIPAASGGTRVWTIQVGASDQTVSAALVTPLPAAQASGFLTQAAADARYIQAALSGSSPAATLLDGTLTGTAGVSAAGSRSDHQHGPDNTAWTAYTGTAPSPTAGAFTTVSGAGAYARIGRTIHYRYTITITSVGTGSGDVRFDLPVAANTSAKAFGYGREDGVGGGIIVVYPFSSTRVTARAPAALANGQVFDISGTYEAAS